MITKEESTILKGLFMLTVVVNHTISLYFNPSSDIAVIINHLCDNVGMFGFTFLSGYGIYKSSRKQMANFWEKRIVSVYIPAFIVNILVLLFSLAMGNTYSRAEINDSVFMLTRQNHINGPLWYIPFIFSWYFIFYIVEIIKYKNKMVGWSLLLGITFIMWYLYPEVHPNATWYAFAFVLGWSCAIMHERQKLCIFQANLNNLARYILNLGICIISFVIICNTNEKTVMGFEVPFRVATVSQNLFTFIFVLSFARIVKLITQKITIHKIGLWLGEVSFEIYLFHYAILVEPVKNNLIEGNAVFLIINTILLMIVAQLFKNTYSKISQYILKSARTIGNERNN